MDKNDFKIMTAKAQADEKYFSLFEKHIPAALADDSRVLLYALGNIDCINKIISKNPRAEYFIYDSDRIITAVKLICDEVRIFKSVDMYDIDMKFDCIIMNPPYEKNLHLKILGEAIKHLKDGDSKCICLHPPQEYKKFKLTSEASNCLLYVESYETYSPSITLKLFGVGTNSGLISAVYSHNLNTEIQDKLRYSRNDVFYKSIFDKIVQAKLPSVKTVFESTYDCTKTIFFNFPEYCGSGGYDGLPIVSNKSYCINGNWQNKPSKKLGFQIVFDDESKLSNFIATYNTNFYKFLAFMFNWSLRIYYNGFPWLGDSINPRTGLKGYESEWTDEDFYKFFNITDDEKKIIEDTMAKYAK